LSSLELPKNWKNQIERVIYQNRMLYEPRMETADTFQDLKSRLKERGYHSLPLGNVVMLNLGGGTKKAPVANTSSYKAVKTMLRKGQ
jgi:hypothetical protein